MLLGGKLEKKIDKVHPPFHFEEFRPGDLVCFSLCEQVKEVTPDVLKGQPSFIGLILTVRTTDMHPEDYTVQSREELRKRQQDLRLQWLTVLTNGRIDEFRTPFYYVRRIN